MEFPGLLPGSQYYKVNVNGSLSLDGSLDVVLSNGFAPRLGDTFDLFNAMTNGKFSSISLPRLNNSFYWDTSELYSNGTITVVPEPSSIFYIIIGTAIANTRTNRQRTFQQRKNP